MVRQIVIAALAGLALSACGVGYDEQDLGLGTVEQTLGESASTQDPVPPLENANELAIVIDADGIPYVVAVASEAPTNPGDEKSSSQDPIPPRVNPLYVAYPNSNPAMDPSVNVGNSGSSVR